jgi:hypothetical protein
MHDDLEPTGRERDGLRAIEARGNVERKPGRSRTPSHHVNGPDLATDSWWRGATPHGWWQVAQRRIALGGRPSSISVTQLKPKLCIVRFSQKGGETMKSHYLIRTSAVLLLIAAVGTAAAWVSVPATAGECAIEYIRTACPGKDAESFSKCGGKQSCVLPEPADSTQACQAAALKACANDRLLITKSKVVHAKFDGKAVMSASGKEDFCADYEKRAAEFDQCAK